MKGLEVLPHGMRRIRQPAMGERIGRQQIAKFIMDDRLRMKNKQRKRSAAYDRQSSNK
jgi:hypothetical protein